MIAVRGLTKRFAEGRGIFELTFEVKAGEVFGYLGPNGAGKSTTLRHLMGFLRADSGTATINNLDCWTDAPQVQASVGYLPGEIGFFDNMTGREFLDLLGRMRRHPHRERRMELIDRFEVDVNVPIRKMSKGMKQKIGLVAALMHQPSVLILDEPTSGLDPLMQQRFLELIHEEKSRGTTILMSSHVFSEVERVCDRVGIIQQGTLVAVQDIHELRQVQRKVFTVRLVDAADAVRLQAAGCRITRQHDRELDIEVQGNDNAVIKALAHVEVGTLDIHPLNLEAIFMQFYGRKEA